MTLKRKRIYIGAVVIGILFSILVVSRYRKFYRNELNENLLSVMTVAGLEVQTEQSLIDSMNETTEDSISNLVGFCAFSLKENLYKESTMDELYSQIKQVGYVYYMHANCNDEKRTAVGTFLAAKGEPNCMLTEQEMYTLCRNGDVVCDGFKAKSSKVEGDNYAVIVWSDDEEGISDDNIQSITAEYGETILYLKNTKEGKVVYAANDIDYVGLDETEILGADLNLNVLCDGDDVVTINTVDGQDSLVVGTHPVDDKYVIVFLPIASMNLNMARSILLPNLLFWIILILMTHFIQMVMKDNLYNENKGGEYHKIGRKHCIDREMSSHIGASVIFGMVLMMLLVTYSQTLINYSNQNMKANSDLHNLEEIVETNESNKDKLTRKIEYYNELLTEAIATFFMEHPGKLSDENLKRLNAKMPYCEDITIYDRTGTSEYTTGTFKGYTISRDETLAEYACWDLIEGTRNVVSFCDEEDNCYIAGRRQDRDGIVRILVNSKEYSNFLANMTIEHTILRADFNKATKIYSFVDDASKLYCVEKNNNQIRVLSNNLPSEAITDGYAGIERFEGVKYYINTNVYKDYIFICAQELITIRGWGIGYILRIIFFCFALTYMLFVVTSLRTVDQMETARETQKNSHEIAHSIEEQMLDDRFKHMLRNMVVFSGVVLVALLVIDAISSTNSLLKFLFSSEWSYGINMFSITMILMMTVTGIVFTVIMRTLIIYVTQNMGPRGLTIGRMISSLLKLVVFIIIITKTLIYVGVNPTTLLASAGIAGAIISFCAQQTVNDLLSGFFIVFEGLFNIGDWIVVDGFRGQVIEIGVRTTKVAMGANVQIINNSELKKITIMARNATGAICDVDIAYKEDATKVIQLINDNVAIYRDSIPEIVEGPYVDGIVELGTSGVTIRMWALAGQENVFIVERQLRRITKQLFDDNNIEIPFTQITLHTDKD